MKLAEQTTASANEGLGIWRLTHPESTMGSPYSYEVVEMCLADIWR
jgi:hypothetical protein